jgi:hypothetical protein
VYISSLFFTNIIISLNIKARNKKSGFLGLLVFILYEEMGWGFGGCF